MTRLYMLFICWYALEYSVLSGTYALNVEIMGEVAIGLKKIKNFRDLKTFGQERAIDDASIKGVVENVTVAPVIECLYQYPDVEQFNAMLSNMMNELTKVFVRVHEFMVHKYKNRRQWTRFSVVEKKEKDFFEDIYANMTREYTSFYNSTSERVARTAEDPCQNQGQLKEVWRSLLERSLTTLRRASLRCIEEYLRSQDKVEDHRARYKLGQYLLRELANVRSTQLHILCDKFQLCFNDLLR